MKNTKSLSETTKKEQAPEEQRQHGQPTNERHPAQAEEGYQESVGEFAEPVLIPVDLGLPEAQFREDQRNAVIIGQITGKETQVGENEQRQRTSQEQSPGQECRREIMNSGGNFLHGQTRFRNF